MAPARVQIDRILCPTDLSPCSARALEQAVRVAWWFDAHVVVLHVVAPTPPVIPADSGAPYIPPPAEAAGVRRAETNRMLQGLVAPFLGQTRSIEACLVEGDPTQEIVAAAQALPAELVVVGTHGRSGLQHLLLGSVTESVLRRACCPVLTVGSAPAAQASQLFRRVLCAADLTEASGRTIDLALSLSEESDAELSLLHVLESLSNPASGATSCPAVPDQGPVRRDVVEHAMTRLRCAVPPAARDWCRVRERVAVGTAWVEILRIASETAADLVVVGAHRRGPISRMLFGSTSSQVVRRAPCPVLVVREAASGPPPDDGP